MAPGVGRGSSEKSQERGGSPTHRMGRKQDMPSDFFPFDRADLTTCLTGSRKTRECITR